MKAVTKLERTENPRKDIPFLFGSYRALVQELGGVDGFAAGLHIATRYFSDMSEFVGSAQDFGVMLAKKYKISTRYIDFQMLPAHLARLSITSTLGFLEEFLTQFRREQKTMGKKWREKEGGESELHYCISCLEHGFNDGKTMIGAHRYEILEYYRLLRNIFTHHNYDAENIASHFQKISHFKTEIEEDFGASPPNDYDHLNFQDHLLFTRCVKYVATDLCRLAYPKTSEEVKRILINAAFYGHASNRSIYNQLGDVDTIRSRLRGLLHKFYNFRLQDQPNVEDEVVEWLHKLPRRKERKKIKNGSNAESSLDNMLAEFLEVDDTASGGDWRRRK